MNKIEKTIYDFVKNEPRLKNTIRNIYQSFYDLFPDKENFFSSSVKVKEGFFLAFMM